MGEKERSKERYWWLGFYRGRERLEIKGLERERERD